MHKIVKNVTINRSCTRFEKNCVWWKTVRGICSDERFRKNFRNTRGTFAYINEKIQHLLIKDTICRGSNLSRTKISGLFVSLR